ASKAGAQQQRQQLRIGQGCGALREQLLARAQRGGQVLDGHDLGIAAGSAQPLKLRQFAPGSIASTPPPPRSPKVPSSRCTTVWPGRTALTWSIPSTSSPPRC